MVNYASEYALDVVCPCLAHLLFCLWFADSLQICTGVYSVDARKSMWLGRFFAISKGKPTWSHGMRIGLMISEKKIAIETALDMPYEDYDVSD